MEQRPVPSEPANEERYFSRRIGTKAATGEKPPTGYFNTMMHLVKGYVGTGIFAMGDAFNNSGMIAGPIILVLIGIINLHCQHLLLAASRKLEKDENYQVKPTFSETVEYTLADGGPKYFQNHARKLGALTTGFVLVTEFGFCCVYYVFISDHLVEIVLWFDKDLHVNRHIMLAVILAPMWISTFLGNLKLLAPLSLAANILMLLALILVFYYTSIGLRDFGCRGQVLGSYQRLPLFFGTALFAYEGITFVLPLRNEMANPVRDYDSCFGVLNVGIMCVCFLMTLVGIMSYWKYGADVAGSVFINFPSDEVLALVATSLVSLAVLFTFTLHMYIPFEVGYPIFYQKYGPFKHPYIIMGIYRTVPVLVTFALANVVPFLGLFISLVGSTTGAVLALILPPILELVGRHREMSVMEIVKDYSILLLGIAGAIGGTALSINEIVLKFREEFRGGHAHIVKNETNTC